MSEIKDLELYAWVGKDEFGSGEIGLKQAMVPAGMIPMVATKREKMAQDYIAQQMDKQGKAYGNKIRLCRFKFEEVIMEVGGE